MLIDLTPATYTFLHRDGAIATRVASGPVKEQSGRLDSFSPAQKNPKRSPDRRAQNHLNQKFPRKQKRAPRLRRAFRAVSNFTCPSEPSLISGVVVLWPFLSSEIARQWQYPRSIRSRVDFPLSLAARVSCETSSLVAISCCTSFLRTAKGGCIWRRTVSAAVSAARDRFEPDYQLLPPPHAGEPLRDGAAVRGVEGNTLPAASEARPASGGRG